MINLHVLFESGKKITLTFRRLQIGRCNSTLIPVGNAAKCRKAWYLLSLHDTVQSRYDMMSET